jgi:hypothetical protein
MPLTPSWSHTHQYIALAAAGIVAVIAAVAAFVRIGQRRKGVDSLGLVLTCVCALPIALMAVVAAESYDVAQRMDALRSESHQQESQSAMGEGARQNR